MRQNCSELLQTYQQEHQIFHTEKLVFKGISGMDVYNITAPLLDQGEQFILGRVEPRASEFSQILAFRQRDGEWVVADEIPPLELQDPFWSRIHGQLVVGGVEVFPHPTKPGWLGWRTKLYRGRNLRELEHFASGPDMMKDIRLAELPDGTIAVFTRPQGDPGGLGTIGYTQISSLDELNPETIQRAELLEQFIAEEWGGANEVHVLEGGQLGVLGHIACFDQDRARHYYAMAFTFDPVTREPGPMRIIATRRDFPPGESKRPDLQDVIFSGGLARTGEDRAWLYAGLSDAEAGRVLIKDPFSERFRVRR